MPVALPLLGAATAMLAAYDWSRMAVLAFPCLLPALESGLAGGDPRIGVFVCHCGENIARTVQVQEVVDFAKDIPGAAVTEDYPYLCSAPGQQMVMDAISEHGLDRVVIAACSPQLHEPTFRAAAAQAGLNPHLVEIANIREHCSWVHKDVDASTTKSKSLVAAAVEGGAGAGSDAAATGAGAAGGGDVEGLLDGDGQIPDVFHQKVVLHTGPRDAHAVNFLESIVADQGSRHLAGEHHHRDRIHVGSRDTGDRVGRPRSGRYQHHTGTAGSARIAVRRMGGSLLVTHQHVLDLILLIQRIIDRQDGPAGIAEHVVDALLGKAANENLSASQLHLFDLPGAGQTQITRKKARISGTCRAVRRVRTG